jgi:hypothetical protein
MGRGSGRGAMGGEVRGGLGEVPNERSERGDAQRVEGAVYRERAVDFVRNGFTSRGLSRGLQAWATV